VTTVLLIALPALSRKFVILDIYETSAATIAALASPTLVLGIVYWLLRERDDRFSSADAMRKLNSKEEPFRRDAGHGVHQPDGRRRGSRFALQ
jgi:hypothetical protein